MVKFVILAVALVLVVAVANANVVKPTGGWFEDGTPGFVYNCAGKVDGDYPHPTKCTHFVACVAEINAYEMPCAMGHDGKRLHYVAWSGPSKETSRCDYPDVAGCGGGCKSV